MCLYGIICSRTIVELNEMKYFLKRLDQYWDCITMMSTSIVWGWIWHIAANWEMWGIYFQRVDSNCAMGCRIADYWCLKIQFSCKPFISIELFEAIVKVFDTEYWFFFERVQVVTQSKISHEVYYLLSEILECCRYTGFIFS